MKTVTKNFDWNVYTDWIAPYPDNGYITVTTEDKCKIVSPIIRKDDIVTFFIDSDKMPYYSNLSTEPALQGRYYKTLSIEEVQYEPGDYIAFDGGAFTAVYIYNDSTEDGFTTYAWSFDDASSQSLQYYSTSTTEEIEIDYHACRLATEDEIDMLDNKLKDNSLSYDRSTNTIVNN